MVWGYGRNCDYVVVGHVELQSNVRMYEEDAVWRQELSVGEASPEDPVVERIILFLSSLHSLWIEIYGLYHIYALSMML